MINILLEIFRSEFHISFSNIRIKIVNISNNSLDMRLATLVDHQIILVKAKGVLLYLVPSCGKIKILMLIDACLCCVENRDYDRHCASLPSIYER